MNTKALKPKEQPKGKLLYLSHENLLTHPRNLRRFYPEEQVREMAGSIHAEEGVLQALLIVPNGKAGQYFVVDGNVRLAGARLLGKECPKLKCELLSKSEAAQLLAMITTAKFRYDPDPVSEALHYERLIKEEEYTVKRIAQATGVHVKTIGTRLELLNLDPEIQELVGNLKLPSDHRVTEAFLSIQDVCARVKLAQRLARDGVTIKAILASCERLKSHLEENSMRAIKGAPALTIGYKRSSGKAVSPDTPVKFSHVRKAAKAMCESCDIKMSLLGAYEPAWSLITHAAEETCKSCSVREVRSVCNSCPGVDIIRCLIQTVGNRGVNG